MSFQSITAGRSGQGWGCSCWIVQDLEADPEGNVVYASGVVNIRRNGILVSTQYINNRGFAIVDGKRIFTPPLFTLSEAQTCLNQLLVRLVAVGMQNGV